MTKLIWLPILGLISIGIGIAFLVLALNQPENSLVAPVLNAFCQPNETLLIREQFNETKVGVFYEYYCESEDGTRRDVDSQVSLIIMLGFLVPFGIGMFIFYRFAMILKNRVLDALKNGSLTIESTP